MVLSFVLASFVQPVPQVHVGCREQHLLAGDAAQSNPPVVAGDCEVVAAGERVDFNLVSLCYRIPHHSDPLDT